MRTKAVPVGIEDFERIINEDYYYVDKTMLIEELLINFLQDLDDLEKH